MKFYRFIVFFFLTLPAAAQNGFTTVSGTIIDPNGIPWAGGTISAQLITSGGPAPTLNGVGFTTVTSPVQLSSTGSFTIRLADSGVIVPSNTTWQFTINIAPGVLPPLGKGAQSFTVTTAINCGTNTPATCTSNQMNITAALVPVPALANVTSGSGSWPTLPGGTNNSSTFFCGTGCSILPSGSGNIQATNIPLNLAFKPDPSFYTLFVGPTCTGGVACSDTNDGLSAGNAMLTTYHAMCSFPGGNCASQIAAAPGGTIIMAPSSQLNPTLVDGIYLAGTTDPHYAAPLPGWLSCNNCSFDFVGIANTAGNPNGHSPVAKVFGGSAADRNHPSVWLSDVFSMRFSNLSFYSFAGRGIVIGECSDNTRSNTCNVVGVKFYNTDATITGSGTNGPCTDITGNSFWIFFDDFGCLGNGSGTGGPTANNAASILVDGSTNNGNGLIITDTNLDNGGIKFIPGASGGSIFVRNVTEESGGPNCSPVLWVTAWATAQQQVSASDLFQADCPNNVFTLQNDAPDSHLGAPVISNIAGVFGPAFGSQPTSNWLAQTISPLNAQQYGINGPALTGEVDAGRRLTGIVATPQTNKAFTNSASWTVNTGIVTITPGQTDPFRGTGATSLFSVAGGAVSLSGVTPVAGVAGDWIVSCLWIKGGGWTPQAFGFIQNGCPGFGGIATSLVRSYPGIEIGDGQWQFVWRAEKASGSPPGGNQCLQIAVNANNTGYVYGPVSMYFPAASAPSDNDMLEIASSMGSIDSACAQGSNCNVAGHPLQFAPDSFSFLGSQPNGTVTYCSNCTIANPCASGGSGAIAKRLNGIWVCN